MVKLDVNSLTLSITEQIVRKLLEDIEKIKKKEQPFLTTPMPNKDMSFMTIMKEERKRGIITVTLCAKQDVKFKIHIETIPNTQESIEYKIFNPQKELPYY